MRTCYPFTVVTPDLQLLDLLVGVGTVFVQPLAHRILDTGYGHMSQTCSMQDPIVVTDVERYKTGRNIVERFVSTDQQRN
jgi:hypothetical protein